MGFSFMYLASPPSLNTSCDCFDEGLEPFQVVFPTTFPFLAIFLFHLPIPTINHSVFPLLFFLFGTIPHLRGVHKRDPAIVLIELTDGIDLVVKSNSIALPLSLVNAASVRLGDSIFTSCHPFSPRLLMTALSDPALPILFFFCYHSLLTLLLVPGRSQGVKNSPRPPNLTVPSISASTSSSLVVPLSSTPSTSMQTPPPRQ